MQVLQQQQSSRPQVDHSVLLCYPYAVQCMATDDDENLQAEGRFLFFSSKIT